MIALLIKASLVIIVLLAFYKLFLQKESFFAANRIYLLSCLVFACTLPFIVLPKVIEHQGFISSLIKLSKEEKASSIKETMPSTVNLNSSQEITPSDLNEVDATHIAISQDKTRSTSNLDTEIEKQLLIDKTSRTEFGNANDQHVPKGLTYWLIALYFFGLSIFLLKLLSQIGRTIWNIYKTDDKIENEGVVLVNKNDDIEPCSFFKYIFINPASYDYEIYEQIIAHEKIHAKQWHTIDLLLSELAVVALWFNPFIWIMRKEVEKNIEYQTDELMVNDKVTMKESYQLNLVKIVSHTKPLPITTNYNQSLIKQRILKMNSKKSNNFSYLKYSFMAPILFGLMLFLNEPVKVNAQPANIISSDDHAPGIIQEESELPIITPELKHREKTDDKESIKLTSDSSTTHGVKMPKELKASLKSNMEPPACNKLVKAIRENNITAIKELIKVVDPNCTETIERHQWLKNMAEDYVEFRPHVQTPLTAAAYFGNLEVVKSVVEAGAIVDFYDGQNARPLAVASYAGHIDVVKYLVEKGAENKGTHYGRGSGLKYAAIGGHLEIVSYLLEQGADVNDGTLLSSAAAYGHLEIVDYLIDKGAIINAHNEYQSSALNEAAGRGHNDIIEFLLSKGAEIDFQDYRKTTALYAAAWSGHMETVELLLSEGANIDLQNDGLRGPALVAAARWGHLDIVKLLVSQGADINLRCYDEGTAIATAYENGHKDVVKYLESKGAKLIEEIKISQEEILININTKLGDCEKLTKAIREENIAAVKELLNSVDPNCTEAFDHNLSNLRSRENLRFVPHIQTPLTAAATMGNLEILKLLLEADAKVDLFDGQLASPLIMASYLGHLHVVKFLVEKRAKINKGASVNGAAIHYAAKKGHLEIVSYLVGKGADLNTPNVDFGTPLCSAAQSGNLELVAFLLDKGAIINAQNGSQQSALNRAAGRGHNEIIELLLLRGADIDFQYGRKSSALHSAAWYGHTETVELLLSKGADIDLQNEDLTGPALVAAAARGRLDIAELLVAKGADVNLRCYRQGTAIAAASENGHQDLVIYLESKGAKLREEIEKKRKY